MISLSVIYLYMIYPTCGIIATTPVNAISCRRRCWLQVAMTSGGGVVIQPNHNSMQTLTLTMATFVIRLLGQLNGQADLPPGPPEVQYVSQENLSYYIYTDVFVDSFWGGIRRDTARVYTAMLL